MELCLVVSAWNLLSYSLCDKIKMSHQFWPIKIWSRHSCSTRLTSINLCKALNIQSNKWINIVFRHIHQTPLSGYSTVLSSHKSNCGSFSPTGKNSWRPQSTSTTCCSMCACLKCRWKAILGLHFLSLGSKSRSLSSIYCKSVGLDLSDASVCNLDHSNGWKRTTRRPSFFVLIRRLAGCLQSWDMKASRTSHEWMLVWQ